MTISIDMRWRAIVFTYIYGIELKDGATVLGVSTRSIERWYKLFKTYGNVLPESQDARGCRWSPECVASVHEYIVAHPCFYLEELKEAVKKRFPMLPNVSMSIICRLLRFDLDLTRKDLCKRARESIPAQIQAYYDKLRPFYNGPDQLVFIDETSKDGRDFMRRCAWSRRGLPAVVATPFARGERLSVVAAMDVTGFLGSGTTTGTFDRHKFHEIFRTEIAPLLNPWPLPRSIVILDNAKIHLYSQLEDMVHARGALLFFLPPYSPQLSPIELGFSLLKRRLKRHTPMAFRCDAQRTLPVAMVKCTDAKEDGPSNMYRHCGYDDSQLNLVRFFE